jgi:hypothetical protein
VVLARRGGGDTPRKPFLEDAKRLGAAERAALAIAAKEAGGFAAKLLTQSSAKCSCQRVLPTAILVVEGVSLDFLKIMVRQDKLACLAVDSSLHTNHKACLLSNEVSYERKIKEALLALRIEQAYSKDKIFELYLNEIYLGLGSYGIAAAALNYFDKPVNQLTIAEAAYLAALPKAPENYNPLRHEDRAIERRNWVIDRMVENGKGVSPTACWSMPSAQRALTDAIHIKVCNLTGATSAAISDLPVRVLTFH